MSAMSLLEILNLSIEYLQRKGIAQPRRQAQDLICDTLGMERMQLYMEYDRPLMEKELELLRENLARRARGEPLQYIHGEVKFFECNLLVTPDVIIPRQETELLVEKIVAQLQQEDLQNKILLDLCAGSGAIGIALKKKFPLLKVILSDISPKALAIASENGKRNGVEVEFLEGDLLAPFEGRKAHYLVCNPPYISEQEFPLLQPEVRNYEPKTALVAGPTGYEIYTRLTNEMKPYLVPGAKIWFEIGAGQGEGIKRLFQAPWWKRMEVESDLAGHDRFFFLEIE
jgi:release factor glutamine methyltransferase